MEGLEWAQWVEWAVEEEWLGKDHRVVIHLLLWVVGNLNWILNVK